MVSHEGTIVSTRVERHLRPGLTLGYGSQENNLNTIALTVEVARLRGALQAVKVDLDKETGARKLREKFAEGAIKRLKEIEEHRGRKLLEGMKLGVDTGVQTNFAEIWAYSGGQITQVCSVPLSDRCTEIALLHNCGL